MLLRVLVHARTVLVVVRTAALRHRGRRVRAVVAVLELGVGACLVDQLRPHGNIPLRRTPINLQIVKAVPYTHAIGVDVSRTSAYPYAACTRQHARTIMPSMHTPARAIQCQGKAPGCCLDVLLAGGLLVLLEKRRGGRGA